MNDVLRVFSPKMKSRVVVLCSFIIEIHVLIIVLRLFVFWCSFPRFLCCIWNFDKISDSDLIFDCNVVLFFVV